MEYPKIRPVSPIPVELPEGKFIYLQDPCHYANESVLLPLEVFSVVQFFNGKRSVTEIQRDYQHHYGMRVHEEDIRVIIEHLDQCFLLESPEFEKHVHRLRQEFAAQSLRISSHKGAAYPDDQHDLIRQFDGYFLDAKGPGTLPGIDAPAEIGVKAIMAPHIDIKAGGPTFARAYHALTGLDAERFVILGTSHVDMQNFLSLTRKTFESPFGHIETDQAFVDALAQRLSYDPFHDEFIHKHEHSIEFQIVFLQYLQQKMKLQHRSVKIVPILCGGSMYEAIVFRRPIAEVPQLEESIEALQDLLRHHPDTCLIASVDFSHIGVRYGDPGRPTDKELALVEQIDRHLLEAMERTDHHNFIAQLQETHNETQVCGFVPIYILLRLVEGTQGTLLHYDRTELSPGSFVSFASMIWR